MINFQEFINTVLAENPEGIYIARFEIEIKKRKTEAKKYINAIIYISPDTEEPEVLSEEPINDIGNHLILGWVDIKEINLTTMTIIANSIKRRYDL